MKLQKKKRKPKKKIKNKQNVILVRKYPQKLTQKDKPTKILSRKLSESFFSSLRSAAASVIYMSIKSFFPQKPTPLGSQASPM